MSYCQKIRHSLSRSMQKCVCIQNVSLKQFVQWTIYEFSFPWHIFRRMRWNKRKTNEDENNERKTLVVNHFPSQVTSSVPCGNTEEIFIAINFFGEIYWIEVVTFGTLSSGDLNFKLLRNFLERSGILLQKILFI